VENAGHNGFAANRAVKDLLGRLFRGQAVADTRLALPPPRFKVA